MDTIQALLNPSLHPSTRGTSQSRAYECPYCLDKGFIEYLSYPTGELVQLPPSQPSGLAIHQAVKQWAIDHGADPDDPWNATKRNEPATWPPCPIRVIDEICDCSRAGAIRNRLHRLLDSGEVPRLYHGYSFDTWEALPSHKRIGMDRMYKACRWLADRDKDPQPGARFSVVLSGPVGIGKTGLASCVLMERARRGQSVLWIDFNDLVSKARATQRPGAEFDYEQIVGAAASVPFLLIDDMGDMARANDISDFVREVVYDVIRKRFDSLRETLITTNLTAEQFLAQFGERINRRVNGDDGMCHWVELEQLIKEQSR